MKRSAFNNFPQIVVRPMGVLSLLPAKGIFTRNASLFCSEELCFSATRISAEESEYFELSWASAEEVAFYACIAIAAHPDGGKVFTFPCRWPLYLKDEGQDLSDSDFLTVCKATLKAWLEEKEQSPNSLLSWEELPGLIAKKPHDLNEGIIVEETYIKNLWNEINTSDALLIRGLSHLLKSAMLQRMSRTFTDTACLELYVALEATMQIILKRLRESGVINPSNKDASDHILEAFGEKYRLDKYYAQFYEDRIKAIHPSSRFGEAKFTPLYVDDLYMLYRDLLRNFEFLITGVANYHTRPTTLAL